MIDFDPDKPTCFLDFDGVINSYSWYSSELYQAEMEKYKDSGLKKINELDSRSIGYLNEISDWNFVLSSAWRKFYTLDHINSLLTTKGFRGKIISSTPVLGKGNFRGNEIHQWFIDNELSRSHRDTGKYIIFDDDGDFLLWQKDNFIHVDGHFGLSPNHVYRAKRAMDKLK